MGNPLHEISVTTDDAGHHVKVSGEATIYSAADLKTRLCAVLSECRALELDLSAVTDIDTAGLQVLLLLRREADEAHRPLTITQISAPARELTRLLGVGAYLGAPDRPEGARS